MTDVPVLTPGPDPTPIAVPPPRPSAEEVRDAALGTDGVVGMHAGTFGEVGTYRPGGRIDGVRMRPDQVEVHVTTAWERNVRDVGDAVRRNVGAVPGLTHTPVLCVVGDIADPPSLIAPTEENS